MMKGIERLVLGRIAIFFISLFLVLNALFALAFVLEPSGTVGRPVGSETYQLMVDELKLDGSTIEQYVNFMTRMLSGDFFTSIYMQRATSDFIYEDALVTGAHFLVVILFSIVAGGIYATLANRWLHSRVGKSMFALAAAVAVTSVWAFLYSMAWALSQLDESFFSEGFNLRVVSCAFFPVAGASVLILEKAMRTGSADGRNHPASNMWRKMSDPFLTGILPFLLVYGMTIVLIAETMFSRSGMGHTALMSIYHMDWPLTMVCIYLVSAMLLGAYLIMDMIFIYARTKEEDQPGFEKVHGSSSDDGIPEHIGLPSLSQFWRAYSRSKVGIVAGVGLLALLCIGLLAPFLATVKDPFFDNFEPFTPSSDSERWTNPHAPTLSPSPNTGFIHPLGTDHIGRDVYSMLLYDTLDALSLALILVALTIAAAVIAGFLRSLLSRDFEALKRPYGWLTWAIADMVLAAPLFLFMSLFWLTLNREVFLYLAVFAWIWAPLGRTAAARLTIFDTGNGSEENRRRFADARTFAGFLRTGKFCFLLTYMSIALTDEFLGSWDTLLDFGWADMPWDAYAFGAFYTGDWWMVIPAVALIGLLAVLVFAVLDRAERILGSWPGNGPGSSSIESTPESSAVDE